MFSPRLKCLPTVLLAVVSPASPGQDRGAAQAVAVVSSLSGNAQLVGPADKKGALSLFDWVQAGAVIEVGAGSKVVLAFANGNRYALAEGTKATITASGPQPSAGSVSPLDPVPPLPHLAAIANTAQAGARSGAIRLRGSAEHIRNLYPRSDTTTLPESTVLRFAPYEGATRYRVEVEDETGRTVFDAETQSSALAVPGGILQPGARYYWKVRTVERIGPSVRAESEFSTLGQEDIRRRTALRVALEKKGDVDSLALLAEIDRRLGLLLEAREGFQLALSKSPGDAALQKAVAEIDAQISSDDENH
jgi:hypothetical protein